MEKIQKEKIAEVGWLVKEAPVVQRRSQTDQSNELVSSLDAGSKDQTKQSK